VSLIRISNILPGGSIYNFLLFYFRDSAIILHPAGVSQQGEAPASLCITPEGLAQPGRYPQVSIYILVSYSFPLNNILFYFRKISPCHCAKLSMHRQRHTCTTIERRTRSRTTTSNVLSHTHRGQRSPEWTVLSKYFYR
jgi:hypothetical protein